MLGRSVGEPVEPPRYGDSRRPQRCRRRRAVVRPRRQSERTADAGGRRHSPRDHLRVRAGAGPSRPPGVPPRRRENWSPPAGGAAMETSSTAHQSLKQVAFEEVGTWPGLAPSGFLAPTEWVRLPPGPRSSSSTEASLSPIRMGAARRGGESPARLSLRSGERVSNPRPQAWEACALPTELSPRKSPYYVLSSGFSRPSPLVIRGDAGPNRAVGIP
jgi:hypothetical protein